MAELFSAQNQQVSVTTEEGLYVGTLVGESTSREFRLAVKHEAVREQDIIAVDAELQVPGSDGETEAIRVWAKVQRIERVNPLFPTESGHELAATETSPFDTVLSLSREMVSAVCRVLGSENREGNESGKLDQLRYPAKPASRAYRPGSKDIARVVLGELESKKHRALDIAHLANRENIDVMVDGHAIVTRHLAILAMTGAGKSWTARRIIEELAQKNYPVVIFDPHGDYTRLSEAEGLENKVQRYYAKFPLFDEDAEVAARVVDSLGRDELTPKMRNVFDDVFSAAQSFYVENREELQERKQWLLELLGDSRIERYDIHPDMWLVAYMAKAGEVILEKGDEAAADRARLVEWANWGALENYSGRDKSTLRGINWRANGAAAALRRMERVNRKVARNADPLPTDRTALVRYGGVSVVSLAGYTGDFQATIYSIIASEIFDARVREDLSQRVLFLLEEAHKFAPAKANTAAEKRAITVSKQIAQEGRKFGVGMILISQRPSRLDETTLSMCNSNIIMRMINPADQNHVRRTVESLGENEANLLPDLDVGEAILSGQLTNFPVLVKMKPPRSRGEREEKDAFAEIKEIHRKENR